jgi:hypothetical protein
MNVYTYGHTTSGIYTFTQTHTHIYHGERKLTGDNLKVVLTVFSTVS